MANNKSSPLKILGFGIAEVIFFVLVIILFFGILNYFNILSLSRLYPNLFGSLPQQNSALKNNPEFVDKFTCPVDSKCNSGETIYFSKAKPPFSGIGYVNLNKGTKLLATLPGAITQGFTITKDQKKNNIITITNRTLGLEVNYSFIGSPIIKNRTIKQGEVIGSLSGDIPDKGYFAKQYILIVSVLNLNNQKFLNLKSIFEQKIER